MSRLKPQEPKTPTAPKNKVTLIGDILPNKNWVIPEPYRVEDANPRTDTGVIQFTIRDEPFVMSRSGLNLGIDEELLPEIIDALTELGFTTDFQILQTGTNDGSEPDHYTKEDYLILQAKVAPSPYLAKFNPNLTKRYPS